MKVIVDTPIWSFVFRKGADAHHAETLTELTRRGQVQVLGAVRQEVLSGIRDSKQFQYIRERLAAFPDLELQRDDYETAAAYFNRCRSRGVQGSNTDFLICAAAVRHDFMVYTTDGDFKLYARHIHLKLLSHH